LPFGDGCFRPLATACSSPDSVAFSPLGRPDTVATTADIAAVIELVGCTNDRLVAERIARLPPTEWVHGAANASIVMVAFLHAAPRGMRSNGSELGAWYAADDIRTAATEPAMEGHLGKAPGAVGER
jgi:hypothetical protein